MNYEKLTALAHKLADEAQAAGCYGVIVALSHEEPPGHSSYNVTSRGRCIEIEGLSQRVSVYAKEIWGDNEKAQLVLKDGRIFEEWPKGSRIFREKTDVRSGNGCSGTTTVGYGGIPGGGGNFE